jgi:hypothetical protein
MINAWRLGGMLGAPVYFGWPAGEGVTWADAESLFEPEFLAHRVLDSHELQTVEAAITQPFADNVARAEVGGEHFLLVNKPFGDIDFTAYGNGAPPDSWEAAVRALSPFHSKLVRRAEAESKRIANPRVMLHVRRGDLADPHAPEFARFVSRYIPYSFFAAWIERHRLCDELPVFSDCPQAADRLRAVGVRARQVVLDQGDLAPCQRDLVELLVLARPSVSVGGKSAFRETAARMGGAKNIRLFNAFDPASRRELMVRELERDDLSPGERISCMTNLAREEFNAGQREKALTIMDRAVEVDPTAPGTRQVFARLLERAGRSAQRVIPVE